MRIKTTIPISEARKKIFKIAEEVQKPDNYYTLTEKDGLRQFLCPLKSLILGEKP